MKKIAILLLCLCWSVSASAQDEVSRWFGGKNNDDIELKARAQGEGMERVITLTAIKKIPGSYTLVLEFRDAMPGAGIYRVLKGYNTDMGSYKYGLPALNISYFPAAINEKKMNEKFAYRLPYAEGESRIVKISRYDNPAKSDIKDVNRCSFNFQAREGDDVYAMRKGIVTEIDMAGWYIEGIADNKVLRKANRSVSVEHGDGSVAIYHNIQEGSVVVKPGDTVFPDDVLGKAGTLDDVTYEIRVSVCYYKCPMIREIPNFSQLECRYIEPCFSTPSGDVQLQENDRPVCKASEELVIAEMTKRQKKERSKNK